MIKTVFYKHTENGIGQIYTFYVSSNYVTNEITETMFVWSYL